METDRVYAVISGDIVQSRRFSSMGPLLRDAIKQAYLQCAEAFDDALGGLPEVDVFAGDSWQVLVSSPARALRVGLCMRALLKSYRELPSADTRIAIGIGDVEFVDEDSLSQSQGEAFMLSGEALDRLREESVRMAVAVPNALRGNGDEQLLDLQETLDMMLVLIDAICKDWTARQSAIVSRALMGRTQVRIAEEMAISQPAVSQMLDAAKWSAVDNALDWWQRTASSL